LAHHDVSRFDAEARRMATLLCSWSRRPLALQDESGTGAAGGITFGLRAAYGASLLPGFAFVTAWLDLRKRIAAADIVITGEGRFDASSLNGKGPAAIAAHAAMSGKTVHLFAGAVSATGSTGVQLHAITPPGTALDAALRDCRRNLAAAIASVFRD
jgi:glycerate kinase